MIHFEIIVDLFTRNKSVSSDGSDSAAKNVSCVVRGIMYEKYKPQCFFCSFFTAVIYTHIYIHIINFHCSIM